MRGGFRYWAMRVVLVWLLVAGSGWGQESLRREVRAIAAEAQGKVSVACGLPGTALNCDLEPEAHPPMQSVFKLPLAMAVLHEVEQGKIALDGTMRFRAEDRILPTVYSPLQDKYPKGDVEVPVRELLRLAVSLSDNVAADILLRELGGPKVLQAYVDSLGVKGFHIEDNEAGLHREMKAQYRNWFAPSGAVTLLRRINDRSPLSTEHTELLLGWMQSSARPGRLAGELPVGTKVFHKTGTSDVDAGVAHATNDIGLLALPDGRRVAVAVFVTDSRADEATRTRVIARIGKAVYEAAAAER